MKRFTMGMVAALAMMLTTSMVVRAEDAKTGEAKEAKKDDKKGESWTGEVGKSDDGTATFKVGEDTFSLKASEKASPGAKMLLTKIGKGELTGSYEVTGTKSEDEAKKKWITVDALHKAGEKKGHEKKTSEEKTK